MELTYKYTYGGHDMATVMVGFVDGKVTSVYTFSGDICHFPREVSAWRPMPNGFIDADEPQKVWEHMKSDPQKWVCDEPHLEKAVL